MVAGARRLALVRALAATTGPLDTCTDDRAPATPVGTGDPVGSGGSGSAGAGASGSDQPGVMPTPTD